METSFDEKRTKLYRQIFMAIRSDALTINQFLVTGVYTAINISLTSLVSAKFQYRRKDGHLR